jgi:hypothetical protein
MMSVGNAIAPMMGLVALIALAGARPAGAEGGAGGGAEKEYTGHGVAAVAGSWTMEIEPSPGSNLPPRIKALITFADGGGCVETILLPPVTSAHGTWERIDRRRFVFAVVHHLVDPQGNFAGTVRAKAFAVFVGKNEFQADFEGALYDPAGNLVAPVSGTERGARITLDAF